MRFFFLITILISGLIQAQEEVVISVYPSGKAVPLKTDYFAGIDEYDNLYYIKGSVFYKLQEGKLISFSDLQLGDISTADLINPLKITLFYKEFNTAVILDNTLNEITRVDFNRVSNFRNVSHARTASDNRLWIFNIDFQKPELFDYRNDRIDSRFPPQEELAVEMTSNFNQLWVRTKNKLLKYNQYGSLLYSEPAADLEHIIQIDERLFGLRNGVLFAKAKNSSSWLAVKGVPDAIKQFYFNKGNLYIYHNDLLSTFKLNLPKN